MDVTHSLKQNFVAGMILIAPLVVTLYILRLLTGWALRVIDPVVTSARLTELTGDVEVLPQAIALALILVGITGLGFLAQRSAAQRLFGNFGRIVNVIPLFSTIYSSVRQVANSLVDRDEAYKSVVLVEYPRPDVYGIGFVTGESPAEIETAAGESMVNVYLPNSPNPTGGRVAFVPEERVYETDMSVRRGMRLLVTTGIGEEATVPTPGVQQTPPPESGR